MELSKLTLLQNQRLSQLILMLCLEFYIVFSFFNAFVFEVCDHFFDVTDMVKKTVNIIFF